MKLPINNMYVLTFPFFCSFNSVQLYRCYLGSHIRLEGSRRYFENSSSEERDPSHQSSVSHTI